MSDEGVQISGRFPCVSVYRLPSKHFPRGYIALLGMHGEVLQIEEPMTDVFPFVRFGYKPEEKKP